MNNLTDSQRRNEVFVIESDSVEQDASQQASSASWTACSNLTVDDWTIINMALGYFGRENRFKRPRSRTLMDRVRRLRRKITGI